MKTIEDFIKKYGTRGASIILHNSTIEYNKKDPGFDSIVREIADDLTAVLWSESAKKGYSAGIVPK